MKRFRVPYGYRANLGVQLYGYHSPCQGTITTTPEPNYEILSENAMKRFHTIARRFTLTRTGYYASCMDDDMGRPAVNSSWSASGDDNSVSVRGIYFSGSQSWQEHSIMISRMDCLSGQWSGDDNALQHETGGG